MVIDIPYLDLDDTIASLHQTLAEDACVRIEQRNWETATQVQNVELWKQQILQTNAPSFMQWCWLSTAFSAPSWSRMAPYQMKEWTPVWVHFLQMDDDSWSQVERLENGRLETQWIRHLRDVLYTQSAQPLLDWWSVRETEGHEVDHDFFWKAAHATLANSPVIAASLSSAWLDEMTRHRTDPALLFDWFHCAAQFLPELPDACYQWLRELSRQDAPVVRLLKFHQDYQNPVWQDGIVRAVLHGVCLQEHSSPWPLLPANIQQLWKIAPACDYAMRLDIAKNFLEARDLISSSERWPLDYPAMERVIRKAAPEADLCQWGTAPWLAGLLHILPEFATVLLFHDILPVSPEQARSLVLLYKDNCEWAKNPDLYKFSSELFENDTISI